MQKWLLVAGAAVLLSFLVACSQSRQQSSEQSSQSTPTEQAVSTAKEAVQEMEGFAIALAPTKDNTATGTVMLMSMGDGVHFSGIISGLTPGPHGMHVHVNGDCSAPDASSAGGHFNPDNAAHGAPSATPHQAGDLGNIIAGADGRAEINIHANGVSLDKGNYSISGRALIVHTDADDLTTQPTGNAGARLACGVIKAAN